MRRILSIGVLSVLTAAMAAAESALITPSQAITWVDALTHFIRHAGMPGVIAVLLLWIGYLEFVKYPKIYKRRDEREEKLEGDIRRLNDARVTDRDAVSSKLEQYLKSSVDEAATIRALLGRLDAFLEREDDA